MLFQGKILGLPQGLNKRPKTAQNSTVTFKLRSESKPDLELQKKKMQRPSTSRTNKRKGIQQQGQLLRIPSGKAISLNRVIEMGTFSRPQKQKKDFEQFLKQKVKDLSRYVSSNSREESAAVCYQTLQQLKESYQWNREKYSLNKKIKQLTKRIKTLEGEQKNLTIRIEHLQEEIRAKNTNIEKLKYDNKLLLSKQNQLNSQFKTLHKNNQFQDKFLLQTAHEIAELDSKLSPLDLVEGNIQSMGKLLQDFKNKYKHDSSLKKVLDETKDWLRNTQEFFGVLEILSELYAVQQLRHSFSKFSMLSKILGCLNARLWLINSQKREVITIDDSNNCQSASIYQGQFKHVMEKACTRLGEGKTVDIFLDQQAKKFYSDRYYYLAPLVSNQLIVGLVQFSGFQRQILRQTAIILNQITKIVSQVYTAIRKRSVLTQANRQYHLISDLLHSISSCSGRRQLSRVVEEWVKKSMHQSSVRLYFKQGETLKYIQEGEVRVAGKSLAMTSFQTKKKIFSSLPSTNLHYNPLYDLPSEEVLEVHFLGSAVVEFSLPFKLVWQEQVTRQIIDSEQAKQPMQGFLLSQQVTQCLEHKLRQGEWSW